MKANQIFQIVNYAAEQALGKSNVVVQDVAGMVSLGDTILSSEASKDDFFSALVDRIAIQIVDVKIYKANQSHLMRNEIEYGAMLQRLYVAPMDATKNDSWDLTDGDSYSPFVVHKPEARQKLFSSLNTWEVPITIPDVQIKSAFLSLEAMTAFIDGIYVQLENSMELQIEAINSLCVGSFMAELINKKVTNPTQTRNLLTEYNVLTGSALSSSACMYDLGFLKYSVTEIKKTIRKMERMSVLFNVDNIPRFTPKEDNRVLLTTQYIESVGAYLQADTFNRDLVDLPKYSEVVYWQGSGLKYEDDDCSTIDIQLASDPSVEVQQSNIIGFISDMDCMGTTINNIRKPSMYNPRTETTNIFFKADIGYFNDLSHNGVVFIAE